MIHLATVVIVIIGVIALSPLILAVGIALLAIVQAYWPIIVGGLAVALVSAVCIAFPSRDKS